MKSINSFSESIYATQRCSQSLKTVECQSKTIETVDLLAKPKIKNIIYVCFYNGKCFVDNEKLLIDYLKGTKNQEFLLSAFDGDSKKFIRLIESNKIGARYRYEGAPYNYFDEDVNEYLQKSGLGYKALQLAAKNNHLDIVRYLVEKVEIDPFLGVEPLPKNLTSKNSECYRYLFRGDPIELFSKEVIYNISQYLNEGDLVECKKVSDAWQNFTLDPQLIIERNTFGIEKWRAFLGDCGPVPPLPENINKILHSPCPFVKGCRVYDTHNLVLFPASVKGKSFTLKYFAELVASRKNRSCRLEDCEYAFLSTYGDLSVTQSYWFLMLKDPSSELCRERNYSREVYCKELGYSFPKIHEAALSIIFEYIALGKSNFYSYSTTYCEERTFNGPCVIGNLQDGTSNDKGQVLLLRGYQDEEVGIAPVRRFKDL